MKIEELQKLIQGCDQPELAARTGLTRSYINALANGVKVNPTMATVDKIVSAVEGMEKC